MGCFLLFCFLSSPAWHRSHAKFQLLKLAVIIKNLFSAKGHLQFRASSLVCTLNIKYYTKNIEQQIWKGKKPGGFEIGVKN